MTRAPILAALIVSLAGCGSDSPDQAVEPLTIRGAMTLRSTDIDGKYDNCRGNGGYSDFDAGMNVTVRDGEGNIVGTGTTKHINAGDTTRDPFAILATDAKRLQYAACMLRFEVAVSDAKFYEITVGRRSDLSYSRADLEAAGWFVSLDLG